MVWCIFFPEKPFSIKIPQIFLSFTKISFAHLIFGSKAKYSSVLQTATADFDITDLYGKWESGTEYYVYNSNGTGYTWDEGDGVYEDEAQLFTWEVDESEMIHVHKMEMGGDVPMYYIITELTESTLKYYDAYNEKDTYTFIKVY